MSPSPISSSVSQCLKTLTSDFHDCDSQQDFPSASQGPRVWGISAGASDRPWGCKGSSAGAASPACGVNGGFISHWGQESILLFYLKSSAWTRIAHHSQIILQKKMEKSHDSFWVQIVKCEMWEGQGMRQSAGAGPAGCWADAPPLFAVF